MGGAGCDGTIWGPGTTTGAIDGERGDPMLGDLKEEDGSGGMNMSPSSIGIGGWYGPGGRAMLDRGASGPRSGGMNGAPPSIIDRGEGNTGDSVGVGVLIGRGITGGKKGYC